jgi:hypothetical protein
METYMQKRDFLGGLIALSLGGLVTAADAQVVIRVAPPAPRDEPPPPARRGYAWVAGRWDWQRGRWVWMRGHWVRARAGHRWEQDRWVERNGRWTLQRGRWARGDRDGDGVPNRMDAAPNNPNR